MSIEPKYVEMIHAAVDGELSPDDAPRLDAYLAESAEGRALRDELQALCNHLGELEPLQPPHGLRETIMRRLPAPRRREQASAGITGMLVDWLRIPAVRYAASFAAGIVAAVLLIDSEQTSRMAFDDVTGLVGTISGVPDHGRVKLQDSVELSLNELAGTVRLGSAGSLMILDFDLVAEDPAEIVVTFDSRDVWFNGFAQLESEGTTVSAERGQVAVRMEGQRRYALYLNNTRQNASTIWLHFNVGGRTVREAQFSIGQGQ